VPPDAWVDPASRRVLPSEEVLGAAAAGWAVLLGETHEAAAHHRWQAATIAGLFARNPELAIGLEMLPRRAQPALDRWVAGSVDEAALLAESDWKRAWGVDFALYRPIFDFARANRIRIVALNVDRALIAKIGRSGWDATDEGEREGVGRPAPPSPGYRERLARIAAEHRRAAPEPSAVEHFIEAQLAWDRAMAEGLLTARSGGAPLIAALVGAGHAERFEGIPNQLAALGAPKPMVLLPWEAGRPCAELAAGLADAVYGVTP
jgi:uncharacterized iron-regulated protein